MALAAATLALAAGLAAGQGARADATACLGTQTSGSGEKLFQTCVTARGTVDLFRTRQAGGDHVYRDGYAICDSGAFGMGQARGWSHAENEHGMAEPTTKTSTKNVRETEDGRFLLTQTFTRDVKEKEMLVTMTLKNLGPGALGSVWLQRYLYASPDGALGTTISLRGAHAILATEGDGGRGIVMGTRTPEISHDTFVEDADAFLGEDHDKDCSPGSDATPTPAGFHVGLIRFNLGSMPQGASKTVKIYYWGF